MDLSAFAPRMLGPLLKYWTDYRANYYAPRVKIFYDGTPEPRVAVEIINKTSAPLIIHKISVTYGTPGNCRGWVLYPLIKVTIAPKDRARWHVSFEANQYAQLRRSERLGPPPYKDNDDPGNPLKLFNAIALGQAEDSWVEIDFNEFSKREFLRGKPKAIFHAVRAALIERAK